MVNGRHALADSTGGCSTLKTAQAVRAVIQEESLGKQFRTDGITSPIYEAAVGYPPSVARGTEIRARDASL